MLLSNARCSAALRSCRRATHRLFGGQAGQDAASLTSGGTNLGIGTNGVATAIQIGATGNVGIGKSPSVALDVNGQVACSSGTVAGNLVVTGTAYTRNVTPDTDGAYNCGDASYRYNNLYAKAADVQNNARAGSLTVLGAATVGSGLGVTGTITATGDIYPAPAYNKTMTITNFPVNNWFAFWAPTELAFGYCHLAYYLVQNNQEPWEIRGAGTIAVCYCNNGILTFDSPEYTPFAATHRGSNYSLSFRSQPWAGGYSGLQVRLNNFSGSSSGATLQIRLFKFAA